MKLKYGSPKPPETIGEARERYHNSDCDESLLNYIEYYKSLVVLPATNSLVSNGVLGDKMVNDERALTGEKEQEVGPKGVPVYKEDDLRAALELLRERIHEKVQRAHGWEIGAYVGMQEDIDSAFPAFAEKEESK